MFDCYAVYKFVYIQAYHICQASYYIKLYVIRNGKHFFPPAEKKIENVKNWDIARRSGTVDEVKGTVSRISFCPSYVNGYTQFMNIFIPLISNIQRSGTLVKK